jgi:general secretion pathway protein D
VRPAILFVVVAIAACSASKAAFEEGNHAARRSDWDEAVVFYDRALRESPDDVEYRIALERALAEAARVHLTKARKLLDAGDLEGAAVELELSLRYDPTRPYVADELESVRRRLQEEGEAPPPVAHERIFGSEPVLDPSSPELIHLKFAEETSLRAILESLGKLAGVNILFDESFRDRRVTVDLQGVTFEQALELLLTTHGLYYKVVTSSVVRVGS